MKKNTDLRSLEVHEAMDRSRRWERTVHHYEGPDHQGVMLGEGGKPVMNCELLPCNASQAAYDRMKLREYALRLERQLGAAYRERLQYEKTLRRVLSWEVSDVDAYIKHLLEDVEEEEK